MTNKDKKAVNGKKSLKAKSNKTNFVPANENISEKIKLGSAIRSRDEYFKDGEVKANHKDNPEMLYRKGYIIDTNSLDEIAIVKSTTGKGHTLKSNNDLKFRPTVYIHDNDGKPIKLSAKDSKNKKFVRSSSEDITLEDVEYMVKRCRKFPDTLDKISKLKSRGKFGKSKPKK